MQSTSLFCGIKTANSPNPVSRLEKRSLYLPKKMHLKFCPSIINAYSYRPSLVRGGIPLPNKVHPITLTEYWPQSTHRELPLPVQHGDEGFAFEHDLPGREPPLLLTGCKWGIQRRILTFTMRGVLSSVVHLVCFIRDESKFCQGISLIFYQILPRPVPYLSLRFVSLYRL